MRGRPDDWTATVRGNWKKVTAYLVSSDHPSCLKMAKDEMQHINRVMQHVPLAAIAKLQPTRHWFMAVIVCPGDNLDGLAAWAKGHDTDRVHFYLHRDAESQILAPWREAGYALDRVAIERYTTYGRMHAQLGRDLSDQVYSDFAP